jgi:thymidylate synthase
MGDYHIYNNHIDALNTQVDRIPTPFPLLMIKCEPKDIEAYVYEDIELLNYKPHPAIKMDMAL